MRIRLMDSVPDTSASGVRVRGHELRRWQIDRDRRDALRDFMATRGEMGAAEAVLCALFWIERVEDVERRADGTPERPAACPSIGDETRRRVSAAEVAALYGVHAGRRLRGVADFLTRLARNELVETAGPARYHTTALGRAVVNAFPNRLEVARLRQVRVRRARPGA